MRPIYVGMGMGSAMGMRLQYLESRVIQQSTTSIYIYAILKLLNFIS